MQIFTSVHKTEHEIEAPTISATKCGCDTSAVERERVCANFLVGDFVLPYLHSNFMRQKMRDCLI